MLVVVGVSLLQGIFQVIGVTSIFPFLAVAADPQQLRDSVVGSQVLEQLPEMTNGQLLMACGGIAIAMLFIANAINLFSEFVRSRYVRGFAHWLRIGLLCKIVQRPYGDFLQQNSGVQIKKVNGDVNQYVQGVLLPLLDCISRFVIIVLLLATLVLVHPVVAVVGMVLLSSFYLIVFGVLARRRKVIADEMKTVNRGLMCEIQQLFAGIKAVKVHCVEEEFVARIQHLSTRQASLLAWMPIYSSFPRYLIEPLALGGLVAIVLAYSMNGKDLTAILPSLGLVAIAVYRLLPAFQSFYSQMTGLSTARHALDEVFDEFMAIEKSISEEGSVPIASASSSSPMQWEHEICLENILFRYPGSLNPVIDGLSVVIPKNSSIGVVGQTGAGKSTLVDLVLGLHMPSGGRVLVDGIPITAENRRNWMRNIGYVPQEIVLVDDSIAANIAFGVPANERDDARLEESARAAQILGFIEEELPDQWQTKVGERGVRLSGGQRQRIGLARALYHRPALLILDEATSALDIETESQVMQSIEALEGSVTLIIIAHRLSTISRCQQRLDLNSGCLDPTWSGQPLGCQQLD
ncbi:ABC transporter ATP-binding protein [Blastopirellula marina]|uniref:ABC transporter ATP-binding protein n=1 Tax=Blastopirellula marina TaxID=124 RepID=A0A2S8G0W0_9BACT|nr:ABC transporter ATP-binding protein [Blastopirellula marina]PQO38077.1 hypothetical protein C5Y98_08310 [Blastopirellula marina]PTL44733.1 ABC transporter ATP-binding protein [Blastopirellula marina]